ncbi:MAG: hypothetical protein RLZZ241_1653 [Bacteroidota bacterium]|jgi:uncharacterized protein (TIGR00255 family)
MIHSMTGFGKHVVQLPGKKITVELKSLNSKNLDLNTRIPQVYRERELSIRGKIGQELQRGKIDLGIYIEQNGDTTSAEINVPVVQVYMKQLGEIALADPAKLMEMALRLPDALKTEREQLDPEEFNAVENALNTAITELLDFRKVEGMALERDILNRIGLIRDYLSEIKHLDAERLDSIRERLKRAVADLEERVDQNRFEQELIYYLEKYDITEEKVRLTKHLEHFTETINSAESNGRKLGFISQEIGREINTIGSKANDAGMQRVVVQMKDELEKIKEQLLNVL